MPHYGNFSIGGCFRTEKLVDESVVKTGLAEYPKIHEPLVPFNYNIKSSERSQTNHSLQNSPNPRSRFQKILNFKTFQTIFPEIKKNNFVYIFCVQNFVTEKMKKEEIKKLFG